MNKKNMPLRKSPSERIAVETNVHALGICAVKATEEEATVCLDPKEDF
jgi:hypothetical protein